MEEFDLKKWESGDYDVVTRDGRSARIICTDRRGMFKICALVMQLDNTENFECVTKKGRYYECSDESKNDLFLVKRKWQPEEGKRYWYIETQGKVNCTNNIENLSKDRIDFGNCFRTKEEAETMAESIKKLLNEK